MNLQNIRELVLKSPQTESFTVSKDATADLINQHNSMYKEPGSYSYNGMQVFVKNSHVKTFYQFKQGKREASGHVPNVLVSLRVTSKDIEGFTWEDHETDNDDNLWIRHDYR